MQMRGRVIRRPAQAGLPFPLLPASVCLLARKCGCDSQPKLGSQSVSGPDFAYSYPWCSNRQVFQPDVGLAGGGVCTHPPPREIVVIVFVNPPASLVIPPTIL